MQNLIKLSKAYDNYLYLGGWLYTVPPLKSETMVQVIILKEYSLLNLDRRFRMMVSMSSVAHFT